ncbi:MAG: YigZ family protein [Erysipelotrichaceae bacterium]
MYTVHSQESYSIELSKSKFISYINICLDEASFKLYLTSIKKLHPNASHYCYAFITNSIQRSNDDGEPSGTAGRPILESLVHANINNCCIVVVRYFGGIKLGTGGLIRAYTQSATNAINNIDKYEMISTKRYLITISYSLNDQFNNYLRSLDLIIDHIDYNESVTYNVLISNPLLIENITEFTNGKAIITFIEDTIFEKLTNCQF